MPREDALDGVKHTEALLARGIQMRPDHTEVFSADQGTKASRHSLLDLGPWVILITHSARLLVKRMMRSCIKHNRTYALTAR